MSSEEEVGDVEEDNSSSVDRFDQDAINAHFASREPKLLSTISYTNPNKLKPTVNLTEIVPISEEDCHTVYEDNTIEIVAYPRGTHLGFYPKPPVTEDNFSLFEDEEEEVDLVAERGGFDQNSYKVGIITLFKVYLLATGELIKEYEEETFY